MVLLIGNYPLDRQQSMQRFATMMLQGLADAGVPAELVAPQPFFGRFESAGSFVAKWLGYIDKFVLFPSRLQAKLGRRPAVVHICDHSNAMYTEHIKDAPVLVTCHDLLAVRGALGEEPYSPASFTGKFLQRWILRGLRRADAIVCDSQATTDDARRLVRRNGIHPDIEVVELGLNYPYRQIARDEAMNRLSSVPDLRGGTPFVLHVGSNLRRKNREGVLRIFAHSRDRWGGKLVFAGDPLSAPLRVIAQELGIADRVVEVINPGNELLEALYNCAVALVYPSRSEGFGWPVAEAQACGCPVICTAVAPLTDIAGNAALLHDADDEKAFASDIVRLNDPAEHEKWSRKSLDNAKRFSAHAMIAHYIEIYRRLAPQL